MKFDVDTEQRRARRSRRFSDDDTPGKSYKSTSERDKDLWELCRLSGPMLEIVDADADMANVPAMIAANATEIVELFLYERDIYPRDLEQALREFEARHFGHQLVPVGHGLLMRAVLDHGDDTRPPITTFASGEERARWQEAIRSAGGPPKPGSDRELWLVDVIRAATGQEPRHVSADWPDPETAEERKRARLQQQAAEILAAETSSNQCEGRA